MNVQSLVLIFSEHDLSVHTSWQNLVRAWVTNNTKQLNQKVKKKRQNNINVTVGSLLKCGGPILLLRIRKIFRIRELNIKCYYNFLCYGNLLKYILDFSSYFSRIRSLTCFNKELQSSSVCGSVPNFSIELYPIYRNYYWSYDCSKD